MKEKIRIKLFGPLREIAGTEIIELDISPPITAGEIIEIVGSRLNLNSKDKEQLRVASEEGYLEKDQEIKKLEIYLIPPVGGG